MKFFPSWLTNPHGTQVEKSSGDDDSLVHIFCCDADRAWCGLDLSNTPLVGEPAHPGDMCVVCLDLEKAQVRCCAGCPGAVPS